MPLRIRDSDGVADIIVGAAGRMVERIENRNRLIENRLILNLGSG
jgi:hypothetical protein